MKETLKKIAPKSFIKLYKKIRLYKYGEIKISTSISDNQIYPDFCAKASLDSKLFNNFKREYAYNRILEHATEQDGHLYIEKIARNNKSLIQEKNIELFKQNDIWGNPRRFNYENIGLISPSTLRYINVYEDLLRLFKDLNDFKICEIGVGYGGQCRIINSISKTEEYTLVDLKKVLMLTQTYLDKYALNTSTRYKTMNELKTESYDLIISNYAFSELPGHIQDVYLNKVILNSKRGYMIFNNINPISFNSYTKEQLLEIIPNSQLINEEPYSSSKNCIIVWGNN
ncbi:MAG: putative sugar O-methyltransferase [Olleya sp.]